MWVEVLIVMAMIQVNYPSYHTEFVPMRAEVVEEFKTWQECEKAANRDMQVSQRKLIARMKNQYVVGRYPTIVTPQCQQVRKM